MTDRGSVRREIQIGRPADVVWQVVGRPELLHLWFPGIVACEVEGTHRRITVATGLTIDETILTNDPVQRRFQYAIRGGLFRDHLATVDVIALDEARSLVIYATDAAPATMALVLAGGAGAALAELARQLDARSGPAVDAAALVPGGVT